MNTPTQHVDPDQQNGHDSSRETSPPSGVGDTRTGNGSGGEDGPRDLIQAFFARFGRLVVRFRYLVVVAWLAATVAAVVFLPTLASVANNNNGSLLPSNQPSVKAVALAAPFQHGSLPQSVIVASRSNGPLTAADNAAITRAETAVRHDAGVVAVQDQGISRDGAARVAQVTLNASAQGPNDKTYVDGIRATFTKVGAPAGLSFYLTGQVATSVDNAAATANTQNLTFIFSIAFILVMLLAIYRAPLAALLTLLSPAVVLFLAAPVIAQSHTLFGVAVSNITQLLLTVLVLGAGTDYGLFLVFRVREEMRRGMEPRAALVKSLSRVGETITFSAGTVIVALLCLLLASFGVYQGLGPAMAIGIAIMLLAGLTLLPALLAIFGRAVFWPMPVHPGVYRPSIWARIAERIVNRPLQVSLAGVLLFGSLATYGLLTYAPAGFGGSTTVTTSQSAQGTNVISAHFPAAQANPTNLLLRYQSSVWQHPSLLAQATQSLSNPVFTSINGPLNANGTRLSPAQLQQLHATLGPAITLPTIPPTGTTVPAPLYNAYRATAQFISPDGRTVQFYATLAAGDPNSSNAMHAVPAVRTALSQAGHITGATDTGVAGQAADAYDVSSVSGSDLVLIVPIVLVVIGILLAAVLRSLVAPWYLLVSVGLSYLAALGLAVLVFMGFGGSSGVNFVLPFLMFVFLMALGSDYNILVMTRIREEAQQGSLPAAVTRAIGATGGTIS
ncbi:MAG TPA: MMPL family transporter, partial [Chloroflexota bacterium]